MAKKIATAEAVFRACDELDASGNPWNRDDVRHYVGGGGFNVIDPLIQAWRKLRPVKAVAPNTPNELLHRLAVSIEQHFSAYLKEIEENAQSREKVFNQATSDLSAEIDNLNQQIATLLQAREERDAQITLVSEQKASALDSLTALNVQHASVQTEKDRLAGQVQRLEQQLETTLLEHQREVQALIQKNEQKLSEKEQLAKHELSQQQRAWREAQESTENRLMRLLDKERHEHKAQMRTQLSEMKSLKAQVNEQQGQLLKLHKTLAQREERIYMLEAEKQALLVDGQKNDALAEIQAAINGLKEKMSTETS